MPIEVDSEIHSISETEFHDLAHQVMGAVFDVHNDFGRLMNEGTYKRAILGRCEAAGIKPCRREVEISVRHKDFVKSYFMDLLFAGALMVEAKTSEALTSSHHAQALHYLLLTRMQHGLLINLRPVEVTKRFVSTRLNVAERLRFNVDDCDWRETNDASQGLRRLIPELLADWGTFLETSLYREAVVHFFGGPSVALRKTPVYDAETCVGTHEVFLISNDTAFALTALKDGTELMQDHLQRFLRHTDLSCMQWINMDNHNVVFRTLTS